MGRATKIMAALHKVMVTTLEFHFHGFTACDQLLEWWGKNSNRIAHIVHCLGDLYHQNLALTALKIRSNRSSVVAES